MSIKDYSTTPASNTSVNGIDISEGCPPSTINNAIRQIMADISSGVYGTTAQITIADGKLSITGSSDTTKVAQFEVDGFTTATTRTFTLPNASTTVVGTDTTQTLSNKTLTAPTINGVVGGTTTSQTITALTAATINGVAAPTAQYTTAEETKLAGIETGADVTDTANVTAAGAVMDSELTNEAAVKAINQGLATTDSPTFAGLTTTGSATVNGNVVLGAISNFYVSANIGTGNPGIVFDSNDYLDFNRTTNTFKLTGDVLELNAPDASQYKLHLSDSTPTIRIGSETGTAYVDIRRDSNGEIHYDAAQATFGEHVFDIAGVEAFRIDNSRNTTFSGNVLASPDNTNTLGGASNRWSVVYAGTGTINTSDERLKEQFTSIEDAEKAAALEIKSAIKKYKFTDAVNSKGDAARWHFGVGAQTVKAIMESHNLIAEDYGFFCYDEWEEQTEQKQVNEGDTVTVTKTREVQATETVTEEVPAEPVYETVVTQEAGNRYGIRYDELAMFILGVI